MDRQDVGRVRPESAFEADDAQGVCALRDVTSLRDREEDGMPSDDLIDGTINFWSPRYGRKLTREEAREILSVLVRLTRWSVAGSSTSPGP